MAGLRPKAEQTATKAATRATKATARDDRDMSERGTDQRNLQGLKSSFQERHVEAPRLALKLILEPPTPRNSSHAEDCSLHMDR